MLFFSLHASPRALIPISKPHPEHERRQFLEDDRVGGSISFEHFVRQNALDLLITHVAGLKRREEGKIGRENSIGPSLLIIPAMNLFFHKVSQFSLFFDLMHIVPALTLNDPKHESFNTVAPLWAGIIKNPD